MVWINNYFLLKQTYRAGKGWYGAACLWSKMMYEHITNEH